MMQGLKRFTVKWGIGMIAGLATGVFSGISLRVIIGYAEFSLSSFFARTFARSISVIGIIQQQENCT